MRWCCASQGSCLNRTADPACGLGRRGRARRGVTLVEVLIVVAIITLMTGAALMGLGVFSSARLKSTASMIAGAVKVAYNHANATSRPTRLVFDFEARQVSIEDSPGKMLIEYGDRAGGAAAANEAEAEAQAAAAEIVEGPRAPKASFAPVKTLGFDPDEGKPGHELSSGIYFRQIEVAHEDEPVKSDRVYLYFWPGGQTQRAAIQLQKGEEAADDSDILTLLVSPLTGKVTVVAGAADMPRPRTDEEESERNDSAF